MLPALPEELSLLIDRDLQSRRFNEYRVAQERLQTLESMMRTAAAEADRARQVQQDLATRAGAGEAIPARAIVDARKAADHADAQLSFARSAVAAAEATNRQAECDYIRAGREMLEPVIIELIRHRIRLAAEIDQANHNLNNVHRSWRENAHMLSDLIGIGGGVASTSRLRRALDQALLNNLNFLKAPTSSEANERRILSGVLAEMPANEAKPDTEAA